MDGLIPSGNRRTFEDFQNQVPKEFQPTFNQLREFCLSLGGNIVENIRMHRIVFGKSFDFRWFADLEPTSQGIILKVQKNRKESPVIFKIKKEGEIEDLKNLINEAFNSIH
jgi:hypothetical protein